MESFAKDRRAYDQSVGRAGEHDDGGRNAGLGLGAGSVPSHFSADSTGAPGVRFARIRPAQRLGGLVHNAFSTTLKRGLTRLP
jgi:hypothetical protein